MPKNDRIRIRHMLDSAREALAFARGRSRTDLDRDRIFALALVKCIEIVGEAAVGLGPATREQYSKIPWADIIGMRNQLIHAYFEIDMDRVWDTVTDDLPRLVTQLEGIDLTEEGTPDA
ncbi:MAG: DUF86 domain-containing protein [Proteobacteria bacterium]|nr:DUF86 domain-containing protein [Pseudomonadota bacterium]